ncbi:MAG: hypothetical protein FWE03_06215 [Firmicutes bacterium]|nr:hypothetical protein [Bacillota bacterium]
MKKTWVWRRNPTPFWAYLMIITTSFLISFVLFLFPYAERDRLIVLIIMFSLLPLYVPIIIFSVKWWLPKIHFDEEKIWRIIKGQKYEWRWDEITSCRLYWFSIKDPPIMLEEILEITTKSDYPKLSFAIGYKKGKFLQENCPSAIVRAKFNK